MDQAEDKNSRGLGLLIRAGGALVPLVPLFWISGVHRQQQLEMVPALRAVLRWVGFLWGWPSAGNQRSSFSFGLMGIAVLLFLVVLLVRRDWRGAAAIVGWSLFWGWLVAYLTGLPG